MKRQFFSGNTLQQAVLAAARKFDLEPERLAYEVRDKKHGFVGGRRKVIIEVNAEAPERTGTTSALPPLHEEGRGLPVVEIGADPGVIAEDDEVSKDRASEASSDNRSSGSWESAGSSSVSESESGSWDEDESGSWDEESESASWDDEESEWDEEEDDELSLDDDDDDPDEERRAVRQAARRLAGLAQLRLDAEVERDDEGFEVDFSGPDADLLTAGDARLLLAIEHLLPRVVRGLVGHGVPCRVDSEGYREEHEEDLRDLALDVADEVRDEGEAQLLEPMTPADRRIIHITLADEAGVETESTGRGFLKRVRVSPT